MAVFHQNVILPFCFILQIPQTTVDTIINQENDPCFDSRHQAQHNGFVRGVTHLWDANKGSSVQIKYHPYK